MAISETRTSRSNKVFSAYAQQNGSNYSLGTSPSMRIYNCEINGLQCDPLTKEEEYVLAKKAQAGDKTAKDRLITANLRFVFKIASYYASRSTNIAYEDILCAGNLGLVRAAQRYDPERDVKFYSYAVWWIRQAVIDAIVEVGGSPVKVPYNRGYLMYRVNRLLTKDPDMSHAEICKELRKEGLNKNIVASEETVKEAIFLSHTLNRDVSFDDVWEGEEGTRMRSQEIFKDSKAVSPEERILQKDMREQIQKILQKYLTDKEKTVLNMYFGLVGDRSLTLQQIGDELEFSKEWARQVRDTALRKLSRHPYARRILKSYLL